MTQVWRYEVVSNILVAEAIFWRLKRELLEIKSQKLCLKRKGNQLTQGNILKFPVKKTADSQCESARSTVLSVIFHCRYCILLVLIAVTWAISSSCIPSQKEQSQFSVLSRHSAALPYVVHLRPEEPARREDRVSTSCSWQAATYPTKMLEGRGGL